MHHFLGHEQGLEAASVHASSMLIGCLSEEKK
jgi:hypothetical protein